MKTPKAKTLVKVNPREVYVPPPAPVFDGSIDGLARLIKGDWESVPDARKRLVDLLRGEEDVKKFVRAADRVLSPSGKGHLPGDAPSLDLVCERAGTNRSIVFGAVARVLHRYHFDVAQIVIGSVVANRAFDVASAMSESAMNPMTGPADRRLFMEVAGAKSRGGAGGINVNVTNQANAQAGAKAEAVQETGRELPSFESGIKNMAARLRAIPVVAER